MLDLNIAQWNAVKKEEENWGGDGALEIAGPLAEGVYRGVLMRRIPAAKAVVT